MASLTLWSFVGCVPAAWAIAVAAHSGRSESAGPAAVMLVSGVSASEEMCITSVGGHLALESCMRAVREGDGAGFSAFHV